MNNNIKEEVRKRIKNKIDISDLIEKEDISNEDLSGAVITKLIRRDSNISGCNFSNCTIGSDNSIIEIIRTNMSNCNFSGCKFIGTAWMRSCNAHNCNFKNADVHKVSYEYTDFSGSTFCESVITIGTRQGIGCIFPQSLFDDLTKNWNFKVSIQPKDK